MFILLGMDFLENNAPAVAKSLIGWKFFVREPDGSLTGGMITETEAYTSEDAASHSFRGKTPRNEVMFGPAGHIYVYFTYGMHWCVNIVTGDSGDGQAVLLRAIQPTHNLATMRQRRANRPDPELTNGPAKLCQALAITGQDNGQSVDGPRFILKPPAAKQQNIMATKRIGISQDKHRLWRFIAT